MMKKKIEFNIPYYGSEEARNLSKYVLENIDMSAQVQSGITDITCADTVFMTGSATSAMELYLASGLLPEGSGVIIPSFTYPAAANAVLAAGLRPVFADIDPDTLVIDIDDVIEKTNGKTSCIMPVHYGGASVDMDMLMSFANDRKLHILEDAALSFGAYYKERHLGTIGDAGVISFHKTKNISGEGGGALLIRNSNEATVFEEMLESGTNRRAFARGETEAYSWQRPGRGMNLSPLSSAVLAAQLEKYPEISKRRKTLWDLYFERLSDLVNREKLKLPVIPDYNKNNHHVFYIILNDENTRERLRKGLLGSGIGAVIHYVPLHSSPFGIKLGYTHTDCPVSQDISSRLLRLPMHMHLDDSEIDFICAEIRRLLD